METAIGSVPDEIIIAPQVSVSDAVPSKIAPSHQIVYSSIMMSISNRHTATVAQLGNNILG